MKALCRDCGRPAASATPRCAACGSPRLAAHPELGTLAVAHLDCDAFYAAIEKRDDPSLADKPVIVGGGKRGVVATACYIARIRGVRSAMPMFKALEACPDAVVIRPNMEKYAAVGREVRQMMLALTPLVEPLSIDEAFMDLAGTERLHGAPPAVSLARLAARIEKEIGITVSIGLSFNKFLAKIASDLEKPRGFSVIGRAEALTFLAEKPVGLIWGVGKAMQARLAADGIRLIGTLQRMDEATLARRYGSMGLRLARLSRADDRRPVEPRGETKSISAETTFDADIADLHQLLSVLRSLAEKVSRRLKKADMAGRTVTLKLKTADFRIRTRSRQLADPTRLADRIHAVGAEMLARETDGTKFRLLGIGVSDFAAPELADPLDLADPDAGRRARAEAAIDAIRGKFGNQAVELGLVFDRPARPKR
ncbi:MAG: DNA polymerase IV [Rhizobiales bacterium]|nr:DNA polymerase IV [Hyphomicrobiales bacterium]